MDDLYTEARFDAEVAHMKRHALHHAQRWASAVQATMRANAPWTDRNGPSMTGLNARQSLVCEAGLADNGDIHIVARSDRMTLTPWRGFAGAPVGLFLELSTRFMTKREILYPTVQAMAPRLKRQIEQAFREMEAE